MATSKKKTTKKVSGATMRILGSKEKESFDLPPYLNTEVSPILLAQAVYTATKRSRVRRAHTKDRAEVRGGGKKPWAQKHTGRARHASIRSPIWVGGGITFGPRSYKSRIVPMNIKQRRLALSGALSTHNQAGTLEFFRLPKEQITKTKDFVAAIDNARGLLMIVSDDKRVSLRAARNIPSVEVVAVSKVSVADIVKAHVVWIDEAALPVLERRCVIAK